MIVYNVTIKIDPQIEIEWLKWKREVYIPAVMATHLFNEYRFFRLLEQDEEGGITYVIQYFTSSLEQYEEYIEKFAPELHKKFFEKWGNQFIAFRTVMQIVN